MPPLHWLGRLDAAIVAGVSLRTLDYWRASGKLKWKWAAGSTRRVLIRSDWLEACLLGKPPPPDDDDGPPREEPLTYEDLARAQVEPDGTIRLRL